MSARAYLDWNATAPLRAEAREAMAAAMDVVGNPSSVHAEGRAAKGLIERARADIAEAFGAAGADIVFTSGATEAAALALGGRGLRCAAVEHEAVKAWAEVSLPVDAGGCVAVAEPGAATLQLANSETGVVQDVPEGLAVCDATQGWGKLPLAFNWLGADMALASAHKFGGPKGVGALILKSGLDVKALLRGGGQELGRRSGTENVIGIAGMAAAAKAAVREVGAGVWQQVEALRDALEQAVSAVAPDAIIVGRGARRLPNTSCIVVPGWKGETQVMLMDLAGFAISAGSACSSGKVRPSGVLKAMGFDDVSAASAIRVSLGPTTTEQDVMRFAEAWGVAYRKFKQKAA